MASLATIIVKVKVHRDTLVSIDELSFDGRAGLLEISLQLLA